MASGGKKFFVSSTFFQKNDIGWPPQPLKERVYDINKKLDFWSSIPQKGTGISHLGARDDQSIRIRRSFNETRLSRSLKLLRPLRSEVAEVLRLGKSLLRTSKSSRHLNSALFACFEKNIFWVELSNIILNFGTFFCRKLLSPANVTFLRTGWWNTNFQTSWSH